METNINALQLTATIIKQFEGWSDIPYLDQAGNATIAWGFTHYPNGMKVTMQDSSITQFRAYPMLLQLLEKYQKSVIEVIKQKLNDNMLASITSFVYNEGIGNFMTSTLLKLININPFDLSGEQSGYILTWKNYLNNPPPMCAIHKALLMFDEIRIDGKLTPDKGLFNRRQAEWYLYSKGIV